MKGVSLVALAVCLPAAAHAYTHTLVQRPGGYARLRWPSDAVPLRFQLFDESASDWPAVAPGSDPVAAIQRALATWPAAAPSLALALDLGPVASAGQDHPPVNIISFADTDTNRAIFELAGGATGLTMYFWTDDHFTETDVLFNPDVVFSTTIESQAALAAADMADVEAVAAHELGHALGLHHSGVESAVMWAISSLAERRLDDDDRAGIRSLYAEPGDFASVHGTVRVNGGVAFGVHVVAVPQHGGVVGGLTLPDGSYRIDHLDEGAYTLYVEPLDGPHASVADDVCLRFSNMSGSGLYNPGTLTTKFATTFFGGNAQPTALSLTPGSDTRADFDLPSGANPLNPTLIGPATLDGDHLVFSVGGLPLELSAGTDGWLAIAGPGLDQVAPAGVFVGGDGLHLDTTNLVTATVTCPAGGTRSFPTLLAPWSAAADAAPGGRALFVSSGGRLSALSGGVRIDRLPSPTVTPSATTTPSRTPGTPPPCVGDCNHDDRITVDELVRGIEAALGRPGIAGCPGFDRDGDGAVTIAELLVAVRGALHGCAPVE